MFKLNLTVAGMLEITAESVEPTQWHAVFKDADSGKTREIDLTPDQLIMVVQFALHPDGEPEGHEAMRAELMPLFEGWPRELLPMP